MEINLLMFLILGLSTNCNKLEIDVSKGNPYMGGQYYVATWGDDMNPGTYEKPWVTWQRAFSRAQAGDTVYFRGGVYHAVAGVNHPAVRHQPLSRAAMGQNGTADNYIHFFNYPGEVPILDGTNRTPDHWNAGISFSHSAFIHVKGLTVRNFKQIVAADPAKGINVHRGSNMIFEQVVVHDIGGPGIFYFSGLAYPDAPQIEFDTTIILNCDFYDNFDHLEGSAGIGGMADGLWVGINPGGFVLIEGNRAWNNSDGGFDSAGNGKVIYYNNWAMANRHPEGDGTSFKFGNPGENNPIYGDTRRWVINNIAAWGSSGFTENNQRRGGNFLVYNNIAYDHHVGFAGYRAAETDTMQNLYKNNISYVNHHSQDWRLHGAMFLNDKVHGYEGWHGTNTWDTPTRGNPTMYANIQDTDFLGGLDSLTIMNQMTAPRKPDGSLPDITVFRLSEGSIFKGKGTYVGMSQNPDMGVDWEYLDRTKGNPFFDLPIR